MPSCIGQKGIAVVSHVSSDSDGSLYKSIYKNASLIAGIFQFTLLNVSHLIKN